MKNYISLATDPITISLGNFPSGLYRISFSITNPFSSTYSLNVSTDTNQSTFYSVKSSKQKDIFYIEFKHVVESEKTPLTIQIHQEQLNSIFFKLVSPPALVDKSIFNNVVHQQLYSPNRLNLLFKETANNAHNGTVLQSRPIDVYSRLLGEIIKLQSEIQSNSAPKLPAGFYELLDLKSAKEQLDYVVNKKIHLNTKGNFLSRPLKKMIKHIFTFIYRVVTKNGLLKTYVAKVYRNYVNMNILSERTLS